MEFMSSSLGVECSFCHVAGHFEKDDKKPKATARAMMRMMFALNDNDFEGKREVTCYSCHRGSRDPVDTAVIANELPSRSRSDGFEVQNLAEHMPSASQLIEDYVNALGGAAAIGKVMSRVEKGIPPN